MTRSGVTVSRGTELYRRGLETVELGPSDWLEHLRIVGAPPGFLSRADPDGYHIRIGRLDGENVATALSFDHAGDRGIYNVGTLEHARRRGLGTALATLLLHEVRDRGCETASLQSTPMAVGIYTAVGFRNLGRILEYVPPVARSANGQVVRR